MAELDVRLFGPGTVRHGDSEPRSTLTPGERALLGYLVLHRGRSHRRESLAHLLWDDADEACARNRLRTALWRLRKTLEPGDALSGTYLISPRRGEIQFRDGPGVWLDLSSVENAAHALQSCSVDDLTSRDVEEIEQDLAVYTGELLEGTDAPWLLLARERYAQMFLNAQAKLLIWHAAAGEFAQAIEAGRRILELDPLREEVHRALIRIYGQRGQRAQAIRQFQSLRLLLRTELDVTPLPETIAVAAEAANGTPPVGWEVASALPDILDQVERAREALDLAADELDRVRRLLSSN